MAGGGEMGSDGVIFCFEYTAEGRSRGMDIGRWTARLRCLEWVAFFPSLSLFFERSFCIIRRRGKKKSFAIICVVDGFGVIGPSDVVVPVECKWSGCPQRPDWHSYLSTHSRLEWVSSQPPGLM